VGLIRKQRADKKIHVNPALDQDTHRKLVKLAISCGMTKTQLAEHLIKMAVNNPDIINHYQNLYNVDDQYRVTPILDKDGNVYY
jgi:hypothetical protein